jgi:hypothetical protein
MKGLNGTSVAIVVTQQTFFPILGYSLQWLNYTTHLCYFNILVTYSHCLSPADHHQTDKKENRMLLIFEEIQSGAVAKSYMRKGFLIYEKMRKYFPIYEEAVSHTYMSLKLLHS